MHASECFYFSWDMCLVPNVLFSLNYFSEKNNDIRIREPMQICIHRKDNLPKLVNHHLTLKEGPKVKSDNIRRFPAHDFL